MLYGVLLPSVPQAELYILLFNVPKDPIYFDQR